VTLSAMPGADAWIESGQNALEIRLHAMDASGPGFAALPPGSLNPASRVEGGSAALGSVGGYTKGRCASRSSAI